MKTVNAYKFSSSAKSEVPTLNIDDPEEFLKDKFKAPFSFGLDSIQSTGYYKLMGWAYDLRPFLRKILVKQYGSWQEYYAPNKTALRKVLFGTIEKMQYLD